MRGLWQDLQHGIRILRKNPSFALIAVLTLALGIGANTAIFTVVNAVVLRPLPYPNPNRLVQVWGTELHHISPDQGLVSYQNFKDLQAENTAFEYTAAYRPAAFALTGQGEPEFVPGAVVSADLFQLLKVKPLFGRTFLPEDDHPGANPVVVIGERLWRDKFGSKSDIIGRVINVNDQPFTVIGVMPGSLRFPFEEISAQMWLPVAQDPDFKYLLTVRGAANLTVIARLKPGVQIPPAQADVNTIASRLAEQFPTADAKMEARVIRLDEQVVGNAKPTLLLLLIAVGFVLLIACVNVANLMLARATSRKQEIALRIAFGAGRFRILRQLLTEAIFLALLGGSVGILLGYGIMHALLPLIPRSFPLIHQVRLDGRVLGFTLLISVAAGVVFGLAPAFQFSDLDLSGTLKEGGRSSTGGASRYRLRNILAIAEITIAVVLLIGSGLLIKSFLRLQQVNLGFDPEGILTAVISLPKSQYANPEQWANFYTDVIRRLKASPGVQSVGAVLPLPLTGSIIRIGFDVEGREPKASGEETAANYSAVSPDYFRAMRIPLLRGRYFSEDDSLNSPQVVIVNEAMAHRFFPNEDPIGKHLVFSTGTGSAVSREIVGIVGNVRRFSLAVPPTPELFTPYLQTPWWVMNLVVRSSSNPLLFAGALRDAVESEDKDLPIANLRSMEDIISDSVATPRVRSLLLGVFAALALLLAAIGIYGVLSYSVGQRTHEIGIRMALGAQQMDVLRLIIGQGLTIVLFGLTLGIAASLGLETFLASMLFSVKPFDAMTYISVSVLILIVALLACYVPIRRALRVDPIISLRYE